MADITSDVEHGVLPPPPDEPPPDARPRDAGGRGFERVPPHSLEAEVSVLGACLLSRAAAIEVSEFLQAEDFYRSAHRTVFEGIQDLMHRSEPVDPVTLLDLLAATGRLAEVGGAQAIHDLVSATPTAANAVHYGRIVRDRALLRRLIQAGTDIVKLGYDPTDDPVATVSAAESIMFSVADSGTTGEAVALKDLLAESFRTIEELSEKGDDVTGLPTGFRDLDRITAGFQPQNLIILAARPAMGKCAAGTTRVTDRTTGERATIEEWVARGDAGKPLHVSSAGGDLRLASRGVSEFHANGIQDTFRLTTWLGRSIRVTANHPLLTPGGWRALEDLAVGDLVAVPRIERAEGQDPLSTGEAGLLGRLLGDGCTGRRRDDRLRPWLEELGLWGCSSHDTFVPDLVFRAPNAQVALFLSRLFTTHGSAWVATGHGGFGISYTAASQRLVRDVQHLLLRFGIVARLRERQVASTTAPGGADTARRPACELEIRDVEHVLRFLDRIGIHARDEACAAVRAAAEAGSTARPLRAWATSDVHWDEVVSIEEHGPEPVYDLTVPGLHNFVADDVVVHNSSLSLSIAQYVTAELQEPVAIFSLEMSKQEIVQRLLASEAMIDSRRIKTGRLEDHDWRKLGEALGKLADAPLFIDDTPSINMMEIASKCRRLKQRHGLRMIIVDYLQLMTSHRRVDNRQEEVSQISRGLKMLAKELDVPVIALSQLNRSPEARTDKRPMLADLRESGAVEQDADVVGFIYRDEVYNEDSPDRGIAELIISKHRNGSTGVVKLAFLGHVTKFANLARGPGAPEGPPGAPPPTEPPL